jgi:hypothetical protein
MPELSSAVKTLNFITDNFDNEDDPVKKKKAVTYANALGLTQKDVMSYRNASQTPDMPESIKTKNMVFSKVASNLPAEEKRGILPRERFAIKNFIDENPALQKKYLDEKGYETRIVKNRVEVRKPDEAMFKVIDPDGMDWSDFALEIGDIGFDVVKGIAEAAGTGAKVVGAIGAPATAGASIGVAAGLGGALGGTTEALRQGIGIAAGLRDRPDTGLIGQEALIGATTGGLLKGAGEAAKAYGLGKKASAAAKLGLRKGSDVLEKGWKIIGGAATAASKFADESVRELEDAIVRSSSNFFPFTRQLKSQVEQNAKAWGKALSDSLDGASKQNFGVGIDEIEQGIKEVGKKADEKAVQVLNTIMGAKQAPAGQLEPVVGENIRKTIMGKLTDKYKEASELYQKVDAAFAGKELVPAKREIYKTIKSLRPKEVGVGGQFDQWLDVMKSNVDEIKTMDGLQDFSRILLDNIEDGNKSVRAAGKAIRSAVLDARSQTFSDTIMNIIKKSKGSLDPMAKKSVAYYEDIYKSLKKADSIYKSLNEDITSIVKRPGVSSSRAFSAKEKLDELAKTSPETIFSKIASENDIEKAKWLMKNYGEEYKQMVSQKLGKIWLEVAQTRKDVRNVVLNEFKKLTDTQKIALLGEKANEKITNVADIVNEATDKIELGNFLDSIYKKVGPSEEFGAAVVNRLKTKSKDELLAIFGPDHVNKVKAIVDIGSFKRSMANPSKTAQNLELFKPSTWLEPLKEIRAEASRINKYKELVIEPSKAGDKMIKTGKRLESAKTFGATEAARSSLITPNREEQ